MDTKVEARAAEGNVDLTALQASVSSRILDLGYFTRSFTDTEVTGFFKQIAFSELYWRTFDAGTATAHVSAFMSAKRLALMTGGFEHFEYSYTPAGTASALFMCADTPDRRFETEQSVQNYVSSRESRRREIGFSIKCYKSPEPVEDGLHVCVYIVDWSPWQRRPALRDQRGNFLDASAFPENVELDSEMRVTDRALKAWKAEHLAEPPPFVPHSLQDVCTQAFVQTKRPEIQERYLKALLAVNSSVSPYVSIAETKDEQGNPLTSITMAFPRERHSYLVELGKVFHKHGFDIVRRFCEVLSNDVEIYTTYVRNRKSELSHSVISSLYMLSLVPTVYTTSGHALLRQEYLLGRLTPEEMMYGYSVMIFSYYFAKAALTTEEYHQLCKALQNDPVNIARLDAMRDASAMPTLTEVRIISALVNHIDFLKACYADFQHKTAGLEMNQPDEELLRRARHELPSVIDQTIFKSLVVFNAAIAKTNFFKLDKGAISFRFDCAMIDKHLSFPFHSVPYAVILFTGAHFRGFHIRYTDIARGGIRIIPGLTSTHDLNKQRLLDENLSLAWTQHNKNKDIPEGGSKGTILVSPHYRGSFRLLFDRYIHAMLDLLIPHPEVVDRYKLEEILFCGPDENTADFMGTAALLAKERGYGYWQSFTTGKPPSMGGVPHDKYGMTTASVRVCVEGIQEKLGLDPSKCTKVMTGGPDGDLGSNEILMGKEKFLGIADGSGSLFDPEGLDNDELTRLAHDRLTVSNFDTSKLSSMGFRVLLSDQNVSLPSGFKVDRGTHFRDNFHLNPLVKADFFVPCGGRPRAVDIKTVGALLPTKSNPELKYKYIIEGANLFFTEDARLMLEKAGVVVFKDASANKGGVTSSSLEVLSGLALPTHLHSKHMCVPRQADGSLGAAPEFYKKYVDAILAFIRNKASLEFDLLWTEGAKDGARSRAELSLVFSKHINSVFDKLYKGSIASIDTNIGREALRRSVPAPLLDLVSLDEVISRVPDKYLRAMICAHLSSEYVYRHGSNADEINFMQFFKSYDVVNGKAK